MGSLDPNWVGAITAVVAATLSLLVSLVSLGQSNRAIRHAQDALKQQSAAAVLDVAERLIADIKDQVTHVEAMFDAIDALNTSPLDRNKTVRTYQAIASAAADNFAFFSLNYRAFSSVGFDAASDLARINKALGQAAGGLLDTQDIAVVADHTMRFRMLNLNLLHDARRCAIEKLDTARSLLVDDDSARTFERSKA